MTNEEMGKVGRETGKGELEIVTRKGTWNGLSKWGALKGQ